MTLDLYTVNGTDAVGAFDPGQYPVQVAEALLPSEWQPLADQLSGIGTTPLINWFSMGIGSDPRWDTYPAATYPMGASVDLGINDLVAAVQSSPVGTPKALAGYSQGAIVTSTFWRDHVLNPAGDCSAYLGDFVAAVNWGNPMRCPTIPAGGNTFAGWPQQSGGGISGSSDLTAAQTPPWWLDFADPNDLYTDSPVGTAAGLDEQLIYNLIVTTSFGGTLEGLLVVLEELVDQLNQPLIEVIGVATAIFNGLTFIAAGPAAGHYTYNIGPAISYLQSVAIQFA